MIEERVLRAYDSMCRDDLPRSPRGDAALPAAQIVPETRGS